MSAEDIRLNEVELANDPPDEDEAPEVAKILDQANTYASHKTIGSQGLTLAIVTYYIDAIYKVSIAQDSVTGFTTAQQWKLVALSVAFAIQTSVGFINFVLLRRKRDMKGRKCMCRSSTLNDLVMILSYVIAILNLAIERIA